MSVRSSKKDRSTSSQTSKGFTLVEIQIALVLLVFIMGLLFSALHLASKSWRVGQAQNDLTEEKRLVAEFLRHQVGQITPLFWIDNQSGSELIFRGNSHSILYVGRLPANRNVRALSLMTLISHDTEMGKRLDLGYGTLDPDQSPFNHVPLTQTRVLDQIKQLQFQYFGRQKTGSSPAEWSDTWENKRRLPQLIKCQITLLNNQPWPEMIFPLHVKNTKGFKQFTLQAPRNNSQNQNRRAADAEHDLDDLL